MKLNILVAYGLVNRHSEFQQGSGAYGSRVRRGSFDDCICGQQIIADIKKFDK